MNKETYEIKKKIDMNNLINELHNKLEAQDKIINTQIIGLNKLQQAKDKLQNDYQEAVDKINELKEINNSIKEVDRKLLERIDKAIDYINKRMVHEGEYWVRKAYHFRNTEYGKDLLEILGDKEND